MTEKEIIQKMEYLRSIIPLKGDIKAKESKFGFWLITTQNQKGKVEISENSQGETVLKYYFRKKTGIIMPNPQNHENENEIL